MAVDASAVARVLGITTQFQDLRAGGLLLLPQRVAVVGQGNTAATYSLDKFRATSHVQVAQRFGFGSPLHLAARQLFPTNGDGVGTIPVTFYPLDDDGAGVAATGDIAPTGTATETEGIRVLVNEIPSEPITIEDGDGPAEAVAKIVTAVSGVLHMPMTVVDNLSTSADFTANWAGVSGNDLHIEVEGTVAGLTFPVTQPSGGVSNPAAADVTTALEKFGNVWETLVLNCLDIADTSVLDAIQTHGEGRWGTLMRKPYVAFTGNTETTVASAIAVPDARKTDRINAQLVSPSSNDLPFVVAARELARIAVVANNNPPRDYGSRKATGLTPGPDGDQWDYAQRDQAVEGGSSTIEVKDGVVNLSDTVTFYHPTGDPLPAFRYVCDIVKIQNVIFNFDVVFATEEWDGAPLIPNGQATVNRSAKTPSMAKGVIFGVLDGLALNAILSDPDSSKDNTTVVISSTNPKRLDAQTTVRIAGNTNIIDLTVNWGFFFGAPAVVAA